jgi:hypothetical protein
MNDQRMTDTEMETVLRTWLQDAPARPPDRSRVVGSVVGQLHSTRRGRRRWWPFARSGREAMTQAIPPRPSSQLDPIPASNGHTPTVIGRTSSMISPAKALIGGALIFGIGGVMLIAQPFQQQSSVPGAEVQPPPAPTAFSATYAGTGRSNPGTVKETDDGTIVSVGQGWLFDSRESSDPRFAGPLVLTATDIQYPDVGGGIGVTGYRIETDEGAWQQVPTANASWEEDGARWSSGQLPPADNIMFFTFIGEGGYEGLTAVVQETWAPGGHVGRIQFDGFIFEGDLPDAPEPWVP